jgi:DNA-binding transcriptional regulator YiaG
VRPAEGPRAELRRAVLANALALVYLDHPADLSAAARLAAKVGPARLVALQEEVLAPIDPQARRPRTTALVVRLARAAWGGPAAGSPADREPYGELAVRLVTLRTHRMPRRGALPERLTRDDLLAGLSGGHLPRWRQYAALVVADPWAGPGSAWLDRLDPDRDAFAVAVLTAVVEHAQRTAAERERTAVVRHIRRAIAESGVSQREFARLIGTSQSRLSTYASGTVVPSATMLVRISQTADSLQRAPRPPAARSR